MTRYACPQCGDTTELRVAILGVADIINGELEVDNDAPFAIDYDHVAYCDACGWDGPPDQIEDNGPDPDQQLIDKEAREHRDQ